MSQSLALTMAIKLPPINYDKLNHLFKKLPFNGKCKDCSQEFDDETYYLCHHPCHQEKYKQTCPPRSYDPNCFKCSLCSKVATNFTNLRYHYQYHAARRFQCLKCDYNAHSLAEIRRHVQKHLDTKLFPCMLCSRQYPDSKSLKEHLVRSHRAEAAYICSQCVNPFKDINQFKLHLAEHYEESASKGGDPGKLFDLRTGVTPTGQTVSNAFKLRRKKRKTRSDDVEDYDLPNLKPCDPIIDPDDIYQPSVSKQLYIPKQQKLPPPPPLQSNGTAVKTYSVISLPRPRQTAHKVSVPRRVNKILGDYQRTFDKKYDNIINSNKPIISINSHNTNGNVSVGTIKVNRPDPVIKTTDVGTFVPPSVGLADFIETD